MSGLVDSVKQQLTSLPNLKKVVVAYSGGVDSHVLLHGCSSLIQTFPHIHFHAVYINHDLHDDSDKWCYHCEKVSKTLDINFTSVKVAVEVLRGDGPEQAARHARYDALQHFIDADSVLLTAQHQDDQAETLMLQLLRGAGVNGLASMPALNAFGEGQIARPLLTFTQQEIMDYALDHQLSWVEDPSNLNTSLDRNFLRQRVIPIIKERWPAFSNTTSRSAVHCAEASSLLAKQAAKFIMEDEKDVLPLAAVNCLDDEFQRLIIRQWLANNSVRMPSQKVLHQMQNEITDEPACSALIEWAGNQVRLFDGSFFLLKKPDKPQKLNVAEWVCGDVELANNLGTLSLSDSQIGGLDKEKWKRSKVTIQARSGGECIKLINRQGTKKLKKLFYEYKVFPWARDLIPLIYLGDKLAAVADIWLAEEFVADKDGQGYEILWHHPNFKIRRQ